MGGYAQLISGQEFWSSVGYWILVVGLIGDICVLVVPEERKRLEKILAAFFTIVIIVGVAIEHRADAKVSVLISEEESASALNVKDLEEKLANAQRDAAVARKEAEGFRFQIAQTNERAVKSEKLAEDERLARIKLEEKLSGWQLDTKSQARLLTALKPYANTPYDLSVNPSEFRFMRILDKTLDSAGWTWQKPKPPPPNPVNGMVIEALFADRAGLDFRSGLFVQIALSRKDNFEKAASALVVGLRKEGIPAQGNILLNPDADPSAIHIIIGSRE